MERVSILAFLIGENNTLVVARLVYAEHTDLHPQE